MNKLTFLKDGMAGKGLGFVSQKVTYLPEDSEERFIKNLKKQPDDWTYRHEVVDYTYNKHGHRCVDIDDLQENYILFAGCSHTEGIGLKLERSYAYLVSQHYNRPYYNLALGGTGPDVVSLNIVGFLSRVKIKPSLVIIQWPDFSRFFHINKDWYFDLHMANNASNIIYKYMINNDIPYRQNVFYRYYALQHLNNHGVNCILENTLETDGDTFKFLFPERVDKARDVSHAGNKTNELWAESLIKDIDKNFAHVLKM